MSDQYLGEIRMFSGNFAPVGWMFCEGQLIDISDYSVLYTLLGTAYGGDGRTNFALPDLRGRIPLHRGTSSSGTLYSLGQILGVESVPLVSNHLPKHTHPVKASSLPGTTSSPSNAMWAGSTISQYSTEEPNNVMGNQTISAVGGNMPHDNMMPFLPISFIIAYQGIYPQNN
jgi:microcystin-dependent protein